MPSGPAGRRKGPLNQEESEDPEQRNETLKRLGAQKDPARGVLRRHALSYGPIRS